MKIEKTKFGKTEIDVLLVQRDEVLRIMEQAKTDERTALGSLSGFINAGKLIVGKGLYKRSTATMGLIATITAGDFQAEFENKTAVFTAGSQAGISWFFGNGATEEEAVSKYLKLFTDIHILTTARNKNGPLYVCGTNRSMRCFQLERR